LVQLLTAQGNTAPPAPATPPHADHPPPSPLPPIATIDRTLSDREAEVLCWISEGKSDWEIGSILKISRKTVNYHVENAKRKLGALTRLNAVIIAIRRGIIGLALSVLGPTEPTDRVTTPRMSVSIAVTRVSSPAAACMVSHGCTSGFARNTSHDL
jgi:DNA-binding CsgD family transcriptional regulator